MTFTTPKHRSRERVVQALYQYMLSGGEVLQIEQQFLNQKSGKISKAFFSNLFINILRNRTELDKYTKGGWYFILVRYICYAARTLATYKIKMRGFTVNDCT
jgi:transcription termination factor NusB